MPNTPAHIIEKIETAKAAEETSIRLSRAGLTHIPKAIADWTELETLSLNNNQISKIIGHISCLSIFLRLSDVCARVDTMLSHIRYSKSALGKHLRPYMRRIHLTAQSKNRWNVRQETLHFVFVQNAAFYFFFSKKYLP